MAECLDDIAGDLDAQAAFLRLRATLEDEDGDIEPERDGIERVVRALTGLRALVSGRGDGRGDRRERAARGGRRASWAPWPRPRTAGATRAWRSRPSSSPPWRARCATASRAGPASAPSPPRRRRARSAPARWPRGRPRPSTRPTSSSWSSRSPRSAGACRRSSCWSTCDELGGGRQGRVLPARHGRAAAAARALRADGAGGPAERARSTPTRRSPRRGRARAHRADRVAHPVAAAPAGARAHRAVAVAAPARRHGPQPGHRRLIRRRAAPRRGAPPARVPRSRAGTATGASCSARRGARIEAHEQGRGRDRRDRGGLDAAPTLSASAAIAVSPRPPSARRASRADGRGAARVAPRPTPPRRRVLPAPVRPSTTAPRPPFGVACLGARAAVPFRGFAPATARCPFPVR